MIDVSIIICTMGRAERLARLLASIKQLDVPQDLSWEILILDNSSEGVVGAFVQPFAKDLPLRVVREARAGLSHARNRALDAAHGQFLCWVDDDVALERDWLAAYVAAFRRHPNASFFGGAIVPHLEPPAPSWVRRSVGDWPLEAAFAARAPIAEAQITPSDIPWGANFALRADTVRGMRFNPELGHGSGRLGEESAFIAHMLDQGTEGWWVPDSRVHHHIGRERQSQLYLEDYFRRAGATLAFLEALRPEARSHPTGWSAARAPSFLLRTLRVAFLPMEWLIRIPGFERPAVRAIARRHLYEGILDGRRTSDTRLPNPHPLAGAVF